MWWLFVLACQTPSVVPAETASVRLALEMGLAAGPLSPVAGPSSDWGGYSTHTVAFDLQPGFSISSVAYVPDVPVNTGVIVAHGHYGEGKSGAEAQEIAHRLAARGHMVLAVDTPGVEEWDIPGRRIHFDAGAHNRAFLNAGGGSAIGLQVAVLRRALDFLESRGVTRVAATGASGGAVQALYLHLVDSRVHASVLASPPRIPREARASGCPCDQIPGWPGPDPHLMAAVSGPSLWDSDVEQPRPEGLPESVQFVLEVGPHSYTQPMQRRAVEFIDRALQGGGGPFLAETPHMKFSAGSPDPAALSIIDLALPVSDSWTPKPAKAVAHTQTCGGKGPTVVVGGGDDADLKALQSAGFRTCSVQLLNASGMDWDPVDLAESVSTQRPLIDRVSGAMAAVATRENAVGVWGARGYGLAAVGVGLPFVVRDPVRTVYEVDPSIDAPWIHVPGGWWGGTDALLSKAVAVGTDREPLVAALSAKVR